MITLDIETSVKLIIIIVVGWLVDVVGWLFS